MSLQQLVPPRSSGNAFGRRRADREMGGRQDNKVHSGKSPSNLNNTVNGSRVVGFDGPSRDRLVYSTTFLRGHRVEVQVKDGSMYSGIFHAASIGKDMAVIFPGIILKMARQTKDGSPRGQKPSSGFVSKAPSKTLIIPAKDLVQVIAKDVSLAADGLSNGHLRERQQDIMIDSYISQSRHVDVERELERWTPDKDDPQCPELDNIFDGTWNRKWDQFETNEALFGVKSTFNEELYTTKLERGPQTRELEREALRIAREIEGEETQDLHLSEERGIFHEDFDFNEESRFSSVFRGVDDGRYEESEDMMLDEHNTETFGVSSGSVINQSFPDRGKSNDGAQASSSCSSAEGSSSQTPSGRDAAFSVFGDHDRQVNSDCSSLALDGESRSLRNPKLQNMPSSLNTKKAIFDKGRLSHTATAYAPSSSMFTKCQESSGSARESSEIAGSVKDSNQPVNARVRPGSSTSSTSEGVGAASVSSAPGLSPSSSMGSLSSEKSSLNPYAKEFKLNPNAKSFTPSLASLRPPPPVSEAPLYFPANASAVQHMHGLSVGIGIGPSYGGQPILYNPPMTPMQSHQAFVHPNGPMYGQQMILGQQRPVLYMPGYPPEMQYKGREF
ncbi:polyadenylate-binding protein-interacting protein 3-like protein [Cinnamomum micranthum f. kanehirae]|uniref:Polyadenylate-binding protein-interacting protein 3-like protein n=1 Tax=Cinnamomum micranthum f. kanehirae TaxID=337451 RepID=A0A443PYT4_9MAGN|nr:polyadenylate-binding protein-interacting protein 3-like protein [Cinnamomum micranthum f. kanehirae]